MSLQLPRRLAAWWLAVAASALCGAAEPLPSPAGPLAAPPAPEFRLGPAESEPMGKAVRESARLDDAYDATTIESDASRIVPIADDYRSTTSDEIFGWQILPQGLIYRPYLAGEKESRFRSEWNHDKGEGDIWDITLGGNVGLLRYGTSGNARPEGVQLGMEGAAQTRLDPEANLDDVATDYRFGIPITWGDSVHQVKFAFYHLSSHVADEYLLTHPGFVRLNYSRNVLVLGHSLYLTEKTRVYAEAGYGVNVDVSQPWEFQFGFDHGPAGFTGIRGAPFWAVNGHLREEVDFGGNFVGQFGWAWRRSPASGLFRMGFDYFNGKSDQFSFFNTSEQKLGYGIWYDY